MDNGKRHGQTKRDVDVDPARRRVIEKAIFTRPSYRGRGSGTKTPPETPTSSQSPARGHVTRTEPDMATSASAITVPRATRRGKRRARGVEESRHRSTNGGLWQVPQTTPLTVEELCEGVLTEEAICNAAGCVTTQQLQGVKKLALVIDSSQVSIDGVWDAVPNLHTLVLNGSRLLSFRDLGVGLRHLNTLSLESSSVEDLDGIGALSGLRELRLSRNRVSDVTPLACHGGLQIIDLQENRVSDTNGLEILSSLPLLYSLNLALNPLMESLNKLRDGKGREVVRQLLPQIRILDGIHLSSGEGGGVDDRILDEADDLVCQGASRARATWAMEKEAEEVALATASAMVSVEPAQEGRRVLKGASRRGEEKTLRGGQSGDAFLFAGPDDCLLRIPRGPIVPSGELLASEVQVGAGPGPTSAPPLPRQGGMMHWDSDLTQGGREALFGNPSSAIRRHNWEKGHGGGRKGHSPTRVLETLDLAKIMEQGFKHRRSTQQSAERVSEWRRETCSDSVPPEDSPFELRDADVLPSGADVSPLLSSGFEKVFDRTRRPETDGAEQESTPLDTQTQTQTATWASLSPSCGRDLNAARAADEVRRMTPAAFEGGYLSSLRPWTTGGFGRGSRRTASVEAAAAVEAYGTSRPERKGGIEAAPHGGDWSGRRRKVCVDPRPVRPQTAKEPGHHRGLPGSEDSAVLQNGSRCTTWQAVWESLQAERLICTPRVAQTAETTMTTSMVNKGDGSEEGELVGKLMPQFNGGLPRKMRSVDFGRQRRARTTAKAVQAGRGNSLRQSDTYNSASEEEASSSGGDDSEEIGDRNLIKERASALSSRDPTTPCVSTISRPLPRDAPASSVLSPYVSSAMRQAAFSGGDSGQEQRHDPRPLESGNTPSGCDDALLVKTRKRETASLSKRRSLAVMDADTSSNGSRSSDDDEGVRFHKHSKSAGAKVGETAKQSLAGKGNGVCGGRVSTSSVVDGESDSDSGGWSSSHRRTSSTHASRKLGFDLKKSLAAIDEWTDKALAATKTGNGGGCSPRQVKSELGGEQERSSCFVGHSPESSAMPAPLSSPHDRAGEKGTSEILESTATADEKVDRERRGSSGSGGGCGERMKRRIIPDTMNIADDGGDGGASGDDDEGEAVMSVAEARAALGISKGFTLAACGIAVASPPVGCARPVPSAAENDACAITNRGDKGFQLADTAAVLLRTSLADDRLTQPQSNGSGGSSSQNTDSSTGGKGVGGKGQGRPRGECARGIEGAGAAATPGTARFPGTAIGMSDEDLKCMLQKQPRTVPELRTKASFREFFQGMKAERMGRLLRGAYEGNLPPDQVDKKIRKRLGLVGDILAW